MCNHATAKYRPGDNSCTFCGSLNPDVFMARLEKGDVSLTPTDKSYKVYIRNEGGEQFKQSFRDCYSQSPDRKPTCAGPDDCPHWVTREIGDTKFYFEHLSPEQQLRFLALLNERKLRLNYPGFFYRLPFFLRLGPPTA
jgi:hypothetical protein